jgi:6-phospho-3-hexuloisomerase
LLLAASGSGTTSTIVGAAERAKQAGAKVIAITVGSTSTLMQQSDLATVMGAAGNATIIGVGKAAKAHGKG